MNKGQSLISILLAISIAAIVLVLGSQIIQVSLKAEEATRRKTISYQLAQEAFEATKAVSEEDWHLIYGKTAGTEYYLDNSTGKWILSDTVGYKTVTLGSDAYLRWLIFSNVSRDSSGDVETSYNTDNDDPSTRKATVHISHNGIEILSQSYYLTRWENTIASQSDWSGDDEIEGPVTSLGSDYSSKSNIEAGAEGLELSK